MKPDVDHQAPTTTQPRSLTRRVVAGCIAALGVLVVGLWFAFGTNETPQSAATAATFSGEQTMLAPSAGSGFTINAQSVSYLPAENPMLGNGVQYLFQADGADTPTVAVSRTTGVMRSDLIADAGSERLVRNLPSAIWGDAVRQIAWIEEPTNDAIAARETVDGETAAGERAAGARVGGIRSTSLSDDELVALANELSPSWLSTPQLPGFSYVGVSSVNGISGLSPSAPGTLLQAKGSNDTDAAIGSYRGDFEVELALLAFNTPLFERVTIRSGKRAAILSRGLDPFDETTVLVWEEEPGLIGIIFNSNLRRDDDESQASRMLDLAEALELITIDR